MFLLGSYSQRTLGLGIKDINKFNLALLSKWKWNLFNHGGERQGVWNQSMAARGVLMKFQVIVMSRYGGET